MVPDNAMCRFSLRVEDEEATEVSLEEIHTVGIGLSFKRPIAEKIVFPLVLRQFDRFITHVDYCVQAFTFVLSFHDKEPFIGSEYLSPHTVMEVFDLISCLEKMKKSLQNLLSGRIRI